MPRQLGRYASLFLFIVPAVLLAASPARAQDPHPEATSVAMAPPGESLGALAGLSGTDLKGTAFQALLDASTDEKTATAVVGWKNGADVYSLTFKGPLNSKTKEATPISLEGLSNGTSLQFALNHLFWSGPNLDEQAEIKKLCLRLKGTESCDYQDMDPGADRMSMERLLHLEDVPWYFGFSGGVSMTKYTFKVGPELREDSDTRTDVGATVRAGFFTPTFGFVIGSVGYQKTSSPGANPVSLCVPLEGTSASTCSETVIKAPEPSKKSAITTVELRRKLTGDVAINPKVQWDVEKKVGAVLLPVYFLRDSKGSLIGGLRGSWRSDTDAVVISLFVGGAFALTPP